MDAELDDENVSGTGDSHDGNLITPHEIETSDFPSFVMQSTFIYPEESAHSSEMNLGNNTSSIIDNPTQISSIEESVDDIEHRDNTEYGGEVGDDESDDDNQYHYDNNFIYSTALCDGVIKHLVARKHQSNYLFATLYEFFGAQLLNDEGLQCWLRKSLGMRKMRFETRLWNWLMPSTNSNKRSEWQMFPHGQIIFDAWIANSTISVDRRDGRDTVKMKMEEFKRKYYGIETTLVTGLINKRNTDMAKAPRYMAHLSVRKMQEMILEKHQIKVSIGSVFNFQPFFVTTPSQRDKLECLCTVSLNAREKFNAVMRCV